MRLENAKLYSKIIFFEKKIHFFEKVIFSSQKSSQKKFEVAKMTAHNSVLSILFLFLTNKSALELGHLTKMIENPHRLLLAFLNICGPTLLILLKPHSCAFTEVFDRIPATLPFLFFPLAYLR